MKKGNQASDEIVDLLDAREREAILLAQELNANLLLLDDMKARRTETDRGLVITGILGILAQAATMKLIDLPAAVQNLQNTSLTMKLIDLPAAVQNLQNTSFWASDSLLQRLLDKHT